ncbi:netrin-4 [Phycodurus eques]|uniref:netrin-4 n=1 Tax=Phycodurus eques TaxID=693459 RepID=UPI002ACE0E5F|nr:netrin-4 [Phycodurus eques]
MLPLLLLMSAAALSGAGAPSEASPRAGVAPRCESRACNPRMGNLALGRRVLTQSVCGNNGSEPYCAYAEPGPPCGAAKCARCNAALPHLSHLAGAMSDSSFRHPDTWWQSAEGVESETVQLDLEAEFYFTHLIAVFRSPRPAAMTLERSQDFGRTWHTLQYYARNCSAAFGVPEGKAAASARRGAACTSKYSRAYPCTRGEVIYRTLPKWESLDPFGPEGQRQLRVTNVRIRLLKRQPCPCQAKDAAAPSETPPTRHFAIYDLIVKGSCFCNGHAEQCVPAPGYQPVRDRTNHVVHGKCVCRHNTAGEHCERCAALYNDRPWQPADGLTGAPHECRKCKCNGHAHSCHFDWSAWRDSGQRSGGVCDCLHDTEGRQCQNCKAGFYRDPRRPHTASNSCKPCNCHPVGSMAVRAASDALCDPANGDCICKPGVGGAHCDRCMVGYWGFHEYGCRPCDCAGDCDPFTGDCVLASDLYNSEGNSSESVRIFRADELFSALHYSEKCECKEQPLTNSHLFCTMNYAYVLKVKVLSAHDKGSHAEVEAKVQKVLSQKVKLQRGRVTLYPESWTARGCTCPILNPGAEYLVAGHADRKRGHLLVNMKSFVKPWTSSLGRKVLTLLKKDCNW